MKIDVYDSPAAKMLTVRVEGNVTSAGELYADYLTTGAIPEAKRPSTNINLALGYYEGPWGRFGGRACIFHDGRVRLTLLSPQGISTGYTSEASASYAF